MIKFAKKLDALLGIVFHIFEWIVLSCSLQLFW